MDAITTSDELVNDDLSGIFTYYGPDISDNAVDGRSIYINGRRQYIDLGVLDDRCLGDNELCVDGLSIAIWLKFDRLHDGKRYVLSTGSQEDGGSGVSIYATQNNLVVDISTQTFNLNISDTVQTNVWTHVAFTWNRTEEGEALKLYFDGSLASDQFIYVDDIKNDNQTTEHVQLGRHNKNYFNHIVGRMDDMMVWEHTISESYISHLYQAYDNG